MRDCKLMLTTLQLVAENPESLPWIDPWSLLLASLRALLSVPAAKILLLMRDSALVDRAAGRGPRPPPEPLNLN